MTTDKLLVVADSDNRRDAFGLPFRDATVVDADGPFELADDVPFDTVVIDRAHLELGWLERVTSDLRPYLRHDARVLVALGASADDPDGANLAFQGWKWSGLTLLGDRVCAVLRASDTDAVPLDTGALIATARSAVDLASELVARGRPTAREVRELLAARESDRRRSERELLAHLATVTVRSDELAAQLRERSKAATTPPTLTALMRTTPSGRRLLHVLGRGKRQLRRVFSKSSAR